MTLENGVDYARRMIPVFEGRECRRTGIRGPSAGDDVINVTHHVAERVGPRLLVSNSRKIRPRVNNRKIRPRSRLLISLLLISQESRRKLQITRRSSESRD